MDFDLRDDLAHGFGPEPAHRPLATVVEQGRRAKRRRRLAGATGGAALTAALVAGLAVAGPLASGQEPNNVADAKDGTLRPESEAAAPGRLRTLIRECGAAADFSTGTVYLKDDATLVQYRTNVIDPAVADNSLGLEVRFGDGRTMWVLMGWADGGSPGALGCSDAAKYDEYDTFGEYLVDARDGNGMRL